MSCGESFVFDGVPSFFRGCCRDASLGGALSYYHAGHELQRHLESLDPYDANDEEWSAERQRLNELIVANDRAAVIDWFVRHFPRCMVFVPKRRRKTFLDGVFGMAAKCGVSQGNEPEEG